MHVWLICYSNYLFHLYTCTNNIYLKTNHTLICLEIEKDYHITKTIYHPWWRIVDKNDVMKYITRQTTCICHSKDGLFFFCLIKAWILFTVYSGCGEFLGVQHRQTLHHQVRGHDQSPEPDVPGQLLRQPRNGGHKTYVKINMIV